MISAEQARKNAEHYHEQTAKAKRQRAEEFISGVIEPKIVEASMNGKTEVSVDIGGYMEVMSEVLGMIHEAGFQSERGRSDSAIRICWNANGTATAHNTRAVVVIR